VSRPFLDIGDGIELRRIDPTDVDELQRTIEENRDRLRMWMWWADGSTLDTTRAFVQAAIDEDKLDPLGIAVDGALVGVIGADGNPITGNHEIGYWIASSHEGRGIVRRACAALISHLFEVVRCHRVVITAGTDNVRSRAIPEALGFTHEGTLREAGKNPDGYHDIEVYGLLGREWPAP
jgi:ribosomal-protein-serine acetyltransferase